MSWLQRVLQIIRRKVEAIDAEPLDAFDARTKAALLAIILRKEDGDYQLEVDGTPDARREAQLRALASEHSTTFSSVWRPRSKMFSWGLEKALVVVAAVSALLVAGLTWHFQALPNEPQPIFAFIVGPAVWMALLQLVYTAAAKRNATRELVLAEVVSIIRVYAAANIIGGFVHKYVDLFAGGQVSASGFADVARKENYLTFFDKSVENLGFFSREPLRHLTSFYTFLKAARDATGSMALWVNPGYSLEKKRDDVFKIVYLCFLQMEHGQLAFKSLSLEDKHPEEGSKILIENVVAGIALQCYLFLITVVQEDDFRYPALVRRLCRYKRLAETSGYTRLWSAACPPQLRDIAHDLAKKPM